MCISIKCGSNCNKTITKKKICYPISKRPIFLFVINVIDEVSHKSQRKVQDQVKFTKAALLQTLEYPLGPYSTSFSAQYGLLCKQIISSYLKLKYKEDQAGQTGRRQVKVFRPLELELWDNQWLL